MTTHDSLNRRLTARLRAISWIAILGMIPVVFYFTTRGTWNPREENDDAAWSAGFFAAQAHSMLRGRLDVDPKAILGECFEREARCYGYFGVTPSLVRIPVIGILRYVRSPLTPVFLLIAIVLAYWATLQMVQRSIRESPEAARSEPLALGYFIAAAGALGPGGSLLFVTRPAVYEEGIAWGVAFVLLALNHVWAWRCGERRSLVPAVVFAVAAANARPTAVTVSAVLGLVVFVLWRYRQQRFDEPPGAAVHVSTIRGLTAALCLGLLPGLTTAGVFWVKLRSPMPSPLLNQQILQAPHWKAIRERNGGRTGGLVFAPTELVAYFRPDTVVRCREWPYFDFRFPNEKILWVPPLPEGGAYVERFSSVTATMPLPWIINLLVVASLTTEAWRLVTNRSASSRTVEPISQTRRRAAVRFAEATCERASRASHANGASRRSGERESVSGSPRGNAPRMRLEEWMFSAGMLASAAVMPALIVTTHGITNRYLADFFATSAVGVALGARVILPVLARRRIYVTAAGIVALLLVCWSIVVTLSLNTRLVF